MSFAEVAFHYVDVDLPPALVFGLVGAWLAVMGAVVGSFLNVVVYRVPAGLNIVFPGSHCPKCKHPIRWHDNVPVLGWLLLRGRCRDCGAAISPRYPAVEAVCAAMFLLLAAFELAGGGANLPARPVAVAGGTITPGLAPGSLGGIYAYHLLLLCTLLAAGLIEYDGHPLPFGLFAPALIVGLAAPLAWPWLRSVPALVMASGRLAGLVDGAAGLAAGCAAGALLRLLAGRKAPAGIWLGPACVGALLGFQAALALGATTAAAELLSRLLPRRLPATAILWLLTIAWIVAWRQLVGAWPMIG